MEAHRITDEVSATDKKTTFTEVLDELCGYYLSIGMTYNDFWHGDIRQMRYYRDAWERKRANTNEELWLQGLYNYRAFKAVMEMFSYGLAGGKGKKPEGYCDRPQPITELEKEAEKKRRIEHTLRWVEKGQEH